MGKITQNKILTKNVLRVASASLHGWVSTDNASQTKKRLFPSLLFRKKKEFSSSSQTLSFSLATRGMSWESRETHEKTEELWFSLFCCKDDDDALCGKRTSQCFSIPVWKWTCFWFAWWSFSSYTEQHSISKLWIKFKAMWLVSFISQAESLWVAVC